MRDSRTKKLTSLAMLSAIAYVIVLITHFLPIPAFSLSFLKYDPKDVVIAIGGMIWGPMAAFIVSLAVSLIEMVTISATGPVGMLMNLISSATFACTASYIYSKKRSLAGAVMGLASGVIATTAMMLLWNYLITPLYQRVERDVIKAMLAPVFLPFNLIKGGLNAAATMLLYKPVVRALRKAGLAPQSSAGGGRRLSAGTLLVSLLVIATGALVLLALNGTI